MKTATETREVLTQTSEKRDFTIKATGKAFKILIDGLYENKIQSIVREIWSNALDSHVAAGCPERPFEVIFPDIYNAVFSVRDFGTSLSHAEIMGLYTTVFESTKEDTNEAIGKFGLGSKSPFAYTDMFTVKAYDGTTLRVYTALISEDGVPQIHFMGEFPCDEERGLEVSFPIRNDDIYAFRQAAERVSLGFDVKPLVKNSDDQNHKWPRLVPIVEGNGWKLVQPDGGVGICGAYAKMGCVLYPINAYAIQELSNEEARLLRNDFILEFEVGELEVNASREALSYGPKEPTSKAIAERVRRITKEMAHQLMEQYKNASTYWEACKMYREHAESHPIPHAVMEYIREHAEYKGRKLQKHIALRKQANFRTEDEFAIPDGIDVNVITGKPLKNDTYRFNYNWDSVQIAAKGDVVVFIENLESETRTKHVAAKIKQCYQIEQFDTVIWIKYRGGKDAAQALIGLLEMMDGIDIRDVSTLPEIAKATSGWAASRPVQVRKFSTAGDWSTRVDLTSAEMAKGGIYVPLYRNAPVIPPYKGGPTKVFYALKMLGEDVIPEDTNLYGVPKSLAHKFSGEQWVNLYDLAEKIYAEREDETKIVEALSADFVQKDSVFRQVLRIAAKVTIHKDSHFHKVAKLCQWADKQDSSFGIRMKNLAELLGKLERSQELVDKAYKVVGELREELLDRYPLLKAFDSWPLRNDVDKLSHYVLVCDKAAELDSLRENETKAA